MVTSTDIRAKLKNVVALSKCRGITVGAYIENIIMAHLESHKAEIKIIEDRVMSLK